MQGFGFGPVNQEITENGPRLDFAVARDLFWIGAVSGHVRGKSVPPRGREFIGRFPYALFAGLGKKHSRGQRVHSPFLFQSYFLIFPFSVASCQVSLCHALSPDCPLPAAKSGVPHRGMTCAHTTWGNTVEHARAHAEHKTEHNHDTTAERKPRT